MTHGTPEPRAGPAASEQADIVLVFDGGSIGNPGKGYGSFAYKGKVVRWPTRIDFPGITTSNQAEYRTLLEALRTIIADLGATGQKPEALSLEVRSDSRLIVEQLNGRWKVKNPELRVVRAECLELLARFARTHVVWHPRSESVRILGH